ncbi:MAG: hypothetical protein WDN03_13840 [Rhizomicrobium sp.]
MESATIAANGYRFRVPYGTLLCVSDRPLHGEIKLPGMADAFYEERVSQHLQIGIKALEYMREEARAGTLHSRKLRSFTNRRFGKRYRCHPRSEARGRGPGVEILHRLPAPGSPSLTPLRAFGRG